MPRARWLLPVVLLATLLSVPLTVGAPWIPDVVNGAGTASTFQVFGQGMAIEGGAYRWNDVCGTCQIRFTLTNGAIVVADEMGIGRRLDPGIYEMREFRGLFAFTQEAPGSFFIEVHGAGSIVRLD